MWCTYRYLYLYWMCCTYTYRDLYWMWCTYRYLYQYWMCCTYTNRDLYWMCTYTYLYLLVPTSILDVRILPHISSIGQLLTCSSLIIDLSCPYRLCFKRAFKRKFCETAFSSKQSITHIFIQLPLLKRQILVKKDLGIPGPLEPPSSNRPSLNMTARSYSCTTWKTDANVFQNRISNTLNLFSRDNLSAFLAAVRMHNLSVSTRLAYTKLH